jgi:hypothetical protein
LPLKGSRGRYVKKCELLSKLTILQQLPKCMFPLNP